MELYGEVKIIGFSCCKAKKLFSNIMFLNIFKLNKTTSFKFKSDPDRLKRKGYNITLC